MKVHYCIDLHIEKETATEEEAETTHQRLRDSISALITAGGFTVRSFQVAVESLPERIEIAVAQNRKGKPS